MITPTRLRPRSVLTGLLIAWGLRVCWLLWGYFLARPGYRRHLVESGTMILVAAGLLLAVTRETAPGVCPASSLPAGELPPGGAPPSWHRALRVTVAMTALALALYWPALRVGLLSDDFVLSAWAAEGGFVRLPETGLFRPVPLATWAAVFAVSGVSPPMLHLLNVALHAVNAALVCGLAAALGLPAAAALFAGLLFLTFPAAAEAVVWCSGIQDVLLTTCALGAVLACRHSGGSAAWAALALLCALLGLGVKETAVVVPVLCCIVVAGTAASRNPRTRGVLAAMFALSAAYVIARAVHGIASTYWRPLSRYFIKELIAQPFATLAVPWRADALAAHPAIGIVTGTVLLGLLVICPIAWTRRDARFQATVRMALWVLCTVAPVFAYFHVTSALEGSRYVYSGAAGWAVALAAMTATAALLPCRWCRGAAVVLAAGVLLAWTSGVRHEVGFWRRAAALRETVLQSAASAARSGNCEHVSLDNAPDSLDGVFVFRNGLAQALASRGLPPLEAPGAVAPGCVFRWTGERFVAASPAPAGGLSP